MEVWVITGYYGLLRVIRVTDSVMGYTASYGLHRTLRVIRVSDDNSEDSSNAGYG